MCGITGYSGLMKNRDQVERAVSAMCDSMALRGPDAVGTAILKSSFFGHRRLSIIDTSDNGRQPFVDQARELMLVVNGEIYNYRSLAEELRGRGHRFRSDSDSEVILHGYAEWGEAIFTKIRGMFAFALYDGKSDTTYLVRDRQGIKPLCYTIIDNDLYFASDQRSLLEIPGIARKAKPQGIYGYLLYGYVPQDLEFIAGLHNLPAGHQLKFKAGKVELSSLWRPFPEPIPAMSEEECLARTRDLLREAVSSHLQSDVPLGIFLSGGIDSTSVLALAKEVSTGPITTLSIGFSDGPSHLDESGIARKIAGHFGTRHIELVATGKDIESRLDKIIEGQGLPSFDGINTYIVSELTKKAGITVALSGLGGDELFGGYGIFGFLPKAYPYLRHTEKLPRVIKKAVAGMLAPALGGKLRRWPEVDDFVSLYAMIRFNGWMNENEGLLSRDYLSANPMNSDPFASLRGIRLPGTTLWDDLQTLEMENYMSWRLLQDTDAMSMANSLEVRVPLIDHQVVDHVRSLPANVKRKFGYPKKLLVGALKDQLPDFVLNRPKQGFALPMREWLLTELAPLVESVLSPEKLRSRGLFSSEQLGGYHAAFKANKIPYEFFWKLIVLELWLDKHRVEVF
ncbi:MAG TPA: asparagine synthase (glutamine-hydrolyzing) [Rectinemataceae bacterium]|nr:asparagine synthase (glutamine-hydrolyzing) [Rectinemataceae bacterium]